MLIISELRVLFNVSSILLKSNLILLIYSVIFVSYFAISVRIGDYCVIFCGVEIECGIYVTFGYMKRLTYLNLRKRLEYIALFRIVFILGRYY